MEEFGAVRLSLFFAVLLSAAVAWYVGFNWVFTRKCVELALRGAGVAASKTGR